MNQTLAHRQSSIQPKTPQLDFILLDASSSMDGPKWTGSIAALDTYVASLKASSIAADIILAAFSLTFADAAAGVRFTRREHTIDTWQSILHDEQIYPSGGTPLYDAINIMARELRDLDPLRCAITIVTDGEESDSKFTSVDQAKSLLDWCRAKGWQVTFIGCDFNNSKTAKLLGARSTEAIGVQKALLSDAAKSLAKKRANYALYGTPMHWTESEQQQFGGYLSHSGAK